MCVTVCGLDELRVACLQVVDAFYNLAQGGSFPGVARTKYRFENIDLVTESIFLSLTFLRPSSPLRADTHTSSMDPLLQQRAIEWRSQLLRAWPHMTDEEAALHIEQLWFAQEMREDLAGALGISREKIRVLSVAPCRSRAIVELVCEDKGVSHDSMLDLSRTLQDHVHRGESVFIGGVPVALYEYLLSVDLFKGYCPPVVGADWHEVKVFVGSSGPDTLPERSTLDRLVLPALQTLLKQHKISFSSVDLSLNACQQGVWRDMTHVCHG
jgi:hypothetical protein